MNEASNSLWVSYKELVENSTSPAELAATFGDSLSWSPGSEHVTITTTTTADGTNTTDPSKYIHIDTSSPTITVKGDTWDPNFVKWTPPPSGQTNPNITISPGSPTWVPGSPTWVPGIGGPGSMGWGTTTELETVIESGPVELSDESKELLRAVEERVSQLLGKHPFARMANMRKALDEILAGKGYDGRFEGMERKVLANGLEGWEAKYSQKLPKSGRMIVSSGIMPTENEALAELIRRAQGG